MNQSDQEYLESKWLDVNARVKKACLRAGTRPEDVRVIGVSKTVEADVMNVSIDAGVRDLGENRVQEILRKYEDVKKGAKWHLIGHLQTNKVKYIIDKVAMIHSVDSLKLAREIDKQAKKIETTMDILIQVDMADEASKFGLAPEAVEGLLTSMEDLENIQVRGLMFIAPFVEDVESIRPYFKQMKTLFETLKGLSYKNVAMDHLSMGMTNDFEVAIEEGATLLRVGTGIYGRR